MNKPLTPEQSAAIADFAAEHGRKWKSELRELWMRAAAPAILHRLRNTHGPSWLVDFKLPKPSK
ncbi:hypothetical protein GCM10011491_41390 [Brucella endophytica]|uniref:Uncharacterized protein n=1 Tax=Brucella endophytica TaxID=1963359 RepID=A0A916WKM9_9HYPH|nr:hypothetical protein [Brucella endophytica]GGB09149.1 hypothetical protein GCM10011491_41390 [Brucella endophytica]